MTGNKKAALEASAIRDLVFAKEPDTVIPRDNSYILSYRHLRDCVAQRQGNLTPTDFVCITHMVYGWMPTVLESHLDQKNASFANGALLLDRARLDGTLPDSDIEQLRAIINNSLVGTSKVLHFVAPDHFPIWDSKIYSFLHRNTSQPKPYHSRVNQILHYRSYISILKAIKSDKRFRPFHSSVNRRLEYEVSALRAIELIMFLNA